MRQRALAAGLAAALTFTASCGGGNDTIERIESGGTAAPTTPGAACPPPRTSAVDGVLPGSGAVTVGGVSLPEGDVRTAGYSDQPDTPVLWTTDDPVDDPWALWAALVDAYPETGLWPLVLSSLSDFGGAGDDGRPWLSNEFDLPADPSTADAVAAADALAEAWAETAPTDADDPDWAAEVLGPLSADDPPLAAASAECAGVLTALAEDSSMTLLFSTSGLGARVGLVAAHRPADALMAMGYSGSVNYTADLSGYTAIMRSWEDRFGGYLTVVGFADITLVMERPPTDDDALLQLAAEVYAVCPDVVWQGVGTIPALAEEIGSSGQLFCWWD